MIGSRRILEEEVMGKTKLIVVAVVVLMFTSAVAAYSHHSFAATYQIDKKITIEGKIVQMIFRNPHSFIHIQVADESGKPATWSIEGRRCDTDGGWAGPPNSEAYR
jgi:hypothetical protein